MKECSLIDAGKQAPCALEAAPAADTAGAIDFLQHWEPEGPWVLTAIIPDGKTETRTFGPGQEVDVERWIAATSGKRNFYFSANRPRGKLSKKASKADIGWVLGTHVDVDLPGKRDADKEASILAKLRAEEPTAIIFSGGGYQGFWRFAEPMPATKDSIWTIEDYNNGLATTLGGDNCHSIDHIMRLPGTVNVPNKKKLAKGRVPTLAYVVEADWANTHKQPLVLTAPKEAANGLASGEDLVVSKETPALDGLADWCQTAIKSGETANSDGDRSRRVRGRLRAGAGRLERWRHLRRAAGPGAGHLGACAGADQAQEGGDQCGLQSEGGVRGGGTRRGGCCVVHRGRRLGRSAA